MIQLLITIIIFYAGIYISRKFLIKALAVFGVNIEDDLDKAPPKPLKAKLEEQATLSNRVIMTEEIIEVQEDIDEMKSTLLELELKQNIQK